MLKLFLLTRGAVLGYLGQTLLIAAKNEKAARKMAADRFPAVADLWLEGPDRMVKYLWNTTNGATCQLIGIAGADAKEGVIFEGTPVSQLKNLGKEPEATKTKKDDFTREPNDKTLEAETEAILKRAGYT